MAYSFLVLFFSFAHTFSSATTVQISDICSKHMNPQNCAAILNSIPGAVAGANLDSLSRYITNFFQRENFRPSLLPSPPQGAFETNTMINELIRNTTNYQELRQRYVSCSADYIDVLAQLNQANDSWKSRDYNGMRSNCESVMEFVKDCDSKQPYDPSALPTSNKYLEDVTIIIKILADFLSGKY